MNQKKLFLLVGVPASGKSAWARHNIDDIENTGAARCAYISRDEIRFSLLEDDEDYFAHEDEVFSIYISKINEALTSDKYDFIFADATHLNEKSRNNILNKLSLDCVDIIPVVFDIPLEICMEQNKNRRGRAKVPNGIIRRMYFSMSIPTNNEKYRYKKIITIKGE